MTAQLLSRRAFIQLAGTAAVAAGALALTGCDADDSSPAEGDAKTDAADQQPASSAGQPAASTGDDNVIRFGCEAAYAPYEWKTSTETEYTLPIENLEGTYADGYDVQLMKAVAEKLGREPVVVNMSFLGLIAALNNGQIDAICSGMSATEDRKESVDFSDPYLHSGVAIMVAKDSPWADATELADFEGASVLGQKSSLPDSVIDQIPGVNHLDPVDFIPESISRLLQGTVDAVVVDANNKEIYEKLYPDFTVVVFEEGKGFDTPGVDPCIAVAKGDPQGILTAANEVIADLTEDKQRELWLECSERAPE